MPPAPAPGKAAEYSPVGPTQVWRSNETARSEGQNGFSGNNSGITPSQSINSNGNVSGDSSNFTTIQKRSDDNSIGSSKTGEDNGSTGSSGNTSGN